MRWKWMILAVMALVLVAVLVSQVMSNVGQAAQAAKPRPEAAAVSTATGAELIEAAVGTGEAAAAVEAVEVKEVPRAAPRVVHRPHPRLTIWKGGGRGAQLAALEEHLYARPGQPLPDQRPSTTTGAPPSQGDYEGYVHRNDASAIAALAADDRPVVRVQISDLVSVDTDVIDNPDASQQWSLYYAATGDQALTTVDLVAGDYELIAMVYGPDGKSNDAIRLDLGGVDARVWGGWGEFEHHSHRPHLIRVEEDGQFVLSIDSTEEPGVQVDQVFLLPVRAHDDAQIATPIARPDQDI